MNDTKHVWVKDSKPVGQIAISQSAGEQERFAAEELASYLKRISGAAVPIVRGLPNRERPSLVILDASQPANRAFLDGLSVDQLEHDGYLIQSRGADVFIVSKEPFGVVHGTYQYLSRALGVRFLDYGAAGEDIPRASIVEHGPVSILKNPRVPYRGMQVTYRLARIDWMAKNGFNWTRFGAAHTLDWWVRKLSDIAPEFIKRGIHIAFGHHIFQMILPSEKYLEDHPEFFPLVDGKRKSRAQFSWNLTSPEVMQEVIRRLDAFLSRHPEIEALDFWPADGQADITPEEYKAVTGEEMPPVGDWQDKLAGTSEWARLGDPRKCKVYALLTKQVAEALAPKHPNVKIVTLAYADLSQPCPEVSLPENVSIVVAMYWRCYRHGVFDEGCPYNEQYLQILREWRETNPNLALHLGEYYMGMTCHASLPYPILTTLFREWPKLLDMGIQGAKVHTGRDADKVTVPYNINYLAFQAIVWDDAATTEEFLERHCRDFFGGAWQEMVEMYLVWERACQDAEHTQPGIYDFHRMFTDEACATSRSLLDKAMQKTDDPKVLHRLSRLVIVVEYTRRALQLSKPIRERHDVMMRGEPTEALDRDLIPRLQDMVEFVQRMQELDLDLFGHPTHGDLLQPGDVEIRRNRWESELGKLMQADWIRDEESPDILQVALERRKEKE